VPKQLVRNPLVWIAGVFAVALAIIFTYAYVGAFLNPTGNARDVPVAVVSEDAGAAFHSIKLNLGGEFASSVTSKENASKEVRFTVLKSRKALLGQMRDDKVFAAIVVPRDFSQKVVALLAGDVSAGKGLQIEILTNPQAGTIASSSGEQIANETVQRFEKAAVTRINAGLSLLGVKHSGALASAFSDTGIVRVEPAVALPGKSALGTGPFFFQLTIVLGGFFMAAIISAGAEVAAGHTKLRLPGLTLQYPKTNASESGLALLKTVFTLLFAVLAALLQTLFAVKCLGMQATNPVALAFFSALGSAAIAMITLFFLLTFDVVGRIVAVLVTILFAVPSSGGVYPAQTLPRFFRFLADFLPLRRMTDGARSLILLNGNSAAGLGSALWVLAGYLVAFALLTLLVVWQRRAREVRVPAGATPRDS
jgi:YhgE/Pip-like protein